MAKEQGCDIELSLRYKKAARSGQQLNQRKSNERITPGQFIDCRDIARFGCCKEWEHLLWYSLKLTLDSNSLLKGVMSLSTPHCGVGIVMCLCCSNTKTGVFVVAILPHCCVKRAYGSALRKANKQKPLAKIRQRSSVLPYFRTLKYPKFKTFAHCHGISVLLHNITY